MSVRVRCVFLKSKSYGSVWCGFKKAEMLRCGSVRCSDIVNPTVRFGAVIYPAVRFGAVFRYSEPYGAVRCCDTPFWYCAVRCGSPLNGFCYGAGPIPVGKTAQNRFFSTVHRMNKPHKIAVSYGSQAFSRGTNETAVSLRCTV